MENTMIANLKPYEEYKESGLPWLGQVPGHWEVRRLKSAVMNVIEQTFEMSSNEVYVALEHVESWTGKAHPQSDSSLFTGQVKRFRQDDVLFGKLRPYLAKVTRISTDGVCAGEFFVLRPTDMAVSAAYLEHQLRAKHTIDVINGSTFGAKMPRADWQFCGNIPFPLPPPNEQAAIVRFLDWANGRLERAIRAKRKVIVLLNEQKQAIIHRAVTRGLDSSVPLKPSGIPWLGDIPQHWEVISLRMRYSVELGKMLDAKRITGRYSIPYLRNRDVQWDRVVTDDLPVMDIPPSEIARYTVKQGDLLVCEGGQVGRSAFWDEQLPVCGFQKALHRVRCLDGSRDHSRFFFYQMQLATKRGVFAADGNENTFAHLTCEKLRRHRFAFPPFIEQRAVADYLDGDLRKFQIAISRLEREIELLREYRTRLVADVVTGKLDVRDAAARLPDDVTASGEGELADVASLDEDGEEAREPLPEEEE
jgi:type I restriction enzyme S subunit